jgi:hypothetical protein
MNTVYEIVDGPDGYVIRLVPHLSESATDDPVEFPNISYETYGEALEVLMESEAGFCMPCCQTVKEK